MKVLVMIWLTALVVGTCLAVQMWGPLGLVLWGRWLVSAVVTMLGVWAWARFCFAPDEGKGQEEPPPAPEQSQEEE